MVNEAHYLAWQILKEREQTKAQDLSRGENWANGYGSFRGWDDVFYRVFYPHETGLYLELHYPLRTWVRRPPVVSGAYGWLRISSSRKCSASRVEV